jgi:hypothetical protein
MYDGGCVADCPRDYVAPYLCLLPDAPCAGWEAEHATYCGDGATGYPVRTWQLSRYTLVYDRFSAGELLTLEAVEGMVAVEGAMLATAGWRDNCLQVQGWTSSRCASPASLLSLLHLNASQHRHQCERGFCVAPPEAVAGLCGSAVAWGALPCTSRAFDWREATLAPPSAWPSLLAAFCSFAPSEADRLLSERRHSEVCDGSSLLYTVYCLLRNLNLYFILQVCDGSSRYLRSYLELGYPREAPS